jgi:MFS transporter, ACS family, solute carrier family 17 (sodium-dependent inorganic phosphate cotransporter), member 5
MALKNGNVESTSTPPILGSTRMAISILGFLGFVNLYAQRVILSVAMVCMVNQTKTPDVLNYTSLPNAPYDVCSFNKSSVAVSTSPNPGEFNWTKSIQGSILASFFYGYMVTQVLGGWMSHRFGGTKVFGWSMLICAVATVFMPIGARIHYGVLMALRIIAGMMQGVVWPAMHCVWSRWAPPLERSTLIGFSFAGSQIGNVLALSISGILCEYGFDGGWPTIFYIFGGFGILWFGAWMFWVSDAPSSHRRISEEEKEYIENSLVGQINKHESNYIPWKSFATSLPLWGIIVTHMCSNWGTYTFLTNIPTYMAEVLKFDIKSNGLLSSVPYLGFWMFINISATAADALRARKLINTTQTRKLFNTLGQVGPALFLIILANVGCDQTAAAVCLLAIGVALSGCVYGSGFVVNHADIAPTYAGLLFGITNTFATIPGFVAPVVIGKMTKNKLQSEWKAVFYLSAAIYVIGTVFYLIAGSGELQSWAKVEEVKRDEEEGADGKLMELESSKL